jgi:hypothetical protein
MMKKVSKIDFSKHVLNILEYPDIKIYEFKKPDTVVHGITIIVGKGITSVTGDFGNWIFCREFHLKKGDYVSRGYLDEKLEIYSVQKSDKFDSEQTLKLIKEFKKDFKDYHGRKMNEEEKEWLQLLIDSVDDEIEYTNIAYREKPSDVEYESVPFGEVRHRHLDIVYDAMNEICDRCPTITLKNI